MSIVLFYGKVQPKPPKTTHHTNTSPPAFSLHGTLMVQINRAYTNRCTDIYVSAPTETLHIIHYPTYNDASYDFPLNDKINRTRRILLSCAFTTPEPNNGYITIFSTGYHTSSSHHITLCPGKSTSITLSFTYKVVVRKSLMQQLRAASRFNHLFVHQTTSTPPSPISSRISMAIGALARYSVTNHPHTHHQRVLVCRKWATVERFPYNSLGSFLGS